MNSTFYEKLADADQFNQKQKFLTLIYKRLTQLLILILLLLITDCALHFSNSTRFVIDLLLIVSVIAIAIWHFIAIAKKRSSNEMVARLIESHAPELGSSLINTLQLSEKLNDANISALSKEFTLKAIDQYNTRYSASEFKTKLKSAELPKQKKKSLVYGLGFIFILVLGYNISKTELLRFLDPFGNHPPFSLTTLTISSPLLTEANVKYGENKQVTVSYKGHKPDELFLSYYDVKTPGLINTLPMYFNGKQEFSQEIKEITTNLIFYAHTLNQRTQSEKFLLTVSLVPELISGNIQIKPPEYTGIETSNRKYEFKPLTVLKKTTVVFDFTSNRPLKSGTIFITPDNAPPFEVTLLPTKEFTVSGKILFETTSNLRLVLTDIDNNKSIQLWDSIVTVQYDTKPTISITNPTEDSFITEDYKLSAIVSMADDYGLSVFRIHRALNGVYSQPKVIKYSGIITSLDQNYLFDIKDLGVSPGDIISFYADVLDNCPYEPHLASTNIINLTIVSVNEYNDYLREKSAIEDIEGKYEDLQNQLEKLIKEQEAISKQLDQLKEDADTGKITPEEYQKELTKALLKQSELIEKIKKLATDMKETVRENPLYDVEEGFKKTLEEESERINKIAESHREEMNKISDQISANSSKENLDDRLKSLRFAGEKLKEELKNSNKKIEEEIVETIEDLSLLQPLLNCINSFQDLYFLQESIVKKLESYRMKSTLTKEDTLALRDLSEIEQELTLGLQNIIETIEKNAPLAEKKFPKAAESALEFSKKMKELELTQLGKIATRNMAIPDQRSSYNSAEKLRQMMDSLFKDAENCKGGICKSEHDSYLSLQKNIPPKNNFEQMCKSKTGKGKGKGGGSGAGGTNAGSSGSSFQSGSPKKGLLGNEKSFADSNDSKNQTPSGRGRDGKALNNLEGVVVEHDKEYNANEIQKNIKNNSSSKTENKYNQYQDIINAYFESLNK